MVINIDNYQITQRTGEGAIVIFKDGKFYKSIIAKPGLSYNELIKVLDLYRND